MKRQFVVLALLACAAACGTDPKVVVRASLTPGGEPIADLPVQLLPYDREELLDSLAEAADDPEPTLPQEVLQQQQDLQAESASVRLKGDTAVARWNAQRRAIAAQVAANQRARAAWRDSAYKDFPEAARAAAVARELSEAIDTTDATGRAVLPAEEGQYWIYARYILPDTELEWNVKMTLTGDSTIVPLTRSNAKEKPLF
ncbi:MAG TPA: hypothetical protein VF584_11480 [Longimicrobium sp.]|jgi:hypothetical protein